MCNMVLEYLERLQTIINWKKKKRYGDSIIEMEMVAVSALNITFPLARASQILWTARDA